MRHLTVRGVPEDLAQALEEEKKRRGDSLNQTVIDLLRRAVGLGPQPMRNGLAKYAASWSKDEFDAFEQSVSAFDAIDEEQWT